MDKFYPTHSSTVILNEITLNPWLVSEVNCLLFPRKPWINWDTEEEKLFPSRIFLSNLNK